MAIPECTVCGHINRSVAVACELCGTRLVASRGGAGAGFIPVPAAAYADPAPAGALPTLIPSPSFQGLGDVSLPTLEVFRRNFLLVALLVLVARLPQAMMQYGIYSSSLVWDDTPTPEIGAWAGGLSLVETPGSFLLYLALNGLANSLLWGALGYAVVELQRTGAARFGASLAWGLRRMPKLVAVTLLTTLLVYVIPGLLLFVTGYAVGSLVVVIFLLALVPWIAYGLMFSLAEPLAAVENRGVFESLARSVELTKGFRGLLFLTYFMWWLLTFVLNLVVGGSFAYAGGGHSLPLLVVQAVVGGLFSSSMIVLTHYVFLGILRERREAYSAHAAVPQPAAG